MTPGIIIIKYARNALVGLRDGFCSGNGSVEPPGPDILERDLTNNDPRMIRNLYTSSWLKKL